MWGFASYKENPADFILANFSDYTVVVPEYPYHNGFNDADIELGSLKSISDYLIPLLNYEGFVDFYAIGFSLGGLVLSDLAKSLTENTSLKMRINKMVIWASPVLGDAGITDVSRLVSDVYIKVPDEKLLPLQNTEALKTALSKRGIKPFHSIWVKKYLQIIKSSGFTSLPEFVPQLYVYDSADVLVSNKNAIYVSRLAETAKQGFVRLVQIRGGGHFGTKKGWDTAIQHIKAFLMET